jgi:hypothetical protein
VQLFARTANDPVRWRLLSTNNREIGRSAEFFADVESCRLAVKEVQTAVDELLPVVRRADANSWIWQVVRDGRAVAVSAHGYDRQIRCGRGLTHFLQEIRTAAISAEVMTSHARRWGGPGA